MRIRWFFYILIGLFFGVFDWFYLDVLQSVLGFLGNRTNVNNASIIVQLLAIAVIVILNWGFWLIPVIPVAIHEIKRSFSIGLTALAAVSVWSFAILSYYIFYASLLLFKGLPNMDFLLFSNRNSSTFWRDWQPAFQHIILNQFIEWIGIALVGGAIVGALTGIVYRRISSVRSVQES